MPNAAPSVLHLADESSEGRTVRRRMCASSCVSITLLFYAFQLHIFLFYGKTNFGIDDDEGHDAKKFFASLHFVAVDITLLFHFFHYFPDCFLVT